MIIDAHNHPDWLGLNFDAIIQNMDEFHIDKTWLLSWEAPDSEYAPTENNPYMGGRLLNRDPQRVPVSFAQVWEYKTKAPDRFILGYGPDPRLPDAIDSLKAAITHFDVKICGEIKFRMMYNNFDALDLFRFCGDAGLPVTLHFDYPGATLNGQPYPRPHWWYGGSIDTLESVLESCPNTIFLGHAPGFWGHLSNDDKMYSTLRPTGELIPGGRVEQLLEKYPNLYCDISAGSGHVALSRDLDYTYRFMNRFADRILYARDMFTNQHQELIESLQLPQDVKELIYHGNAERLIK